MHCSLIFNKMGLLFRRNGDIPHENAKFDENSDLRKSICKGDFLCGPLTTKKTNKVTTTQKNRQKNRRKNRTTIFQSAIRSAAAAIFTEATEQAHHPRPSITVNRRSLKKAAFCPQYSFAPLYFSLRWQPFICSEINSLSPA